MPRPVHHITRERISVSDCLQRHFRLTLQRARELLHLGAIYFEGGRVLEDRILPRGAHLQIYLSPVRFPADEIDWRAIIRFEGDDFLVVNKPAGIPVHATVDNRLDNVLERLRKALLSPLAVTHRLDAPVAGLLILAKTPDFQRGFNARLAERGVSKRYRALAEKPVPTGRHVHHLEPGESQPRRMANDPAAGRLPCELEITTFREGRIPPSPRAYYEMQIALRTGRTHQIRAQLAALGAPILGDRLYGSTVRYSRLELGRGIGLFSACVEWKDDSGQRWYFEADPPWKERLRLL